MHSDPDRISRSGTESCAARRCSPGGSYAEPENSAWSVAGFYGTARPSAASGNDARRRFVDLEDTFETATRSANDTRAASGAHCRAQLLAGIKRDPTSFSAALRKHGGGA